MRDHRVARIFRIDVEQTFVRRFLQNPGADLAPVGVFGYLEVERMYPERFPRQLSRLTVSQEQAAVLDRQGADTVDEKPGQQRQCQVQVQAAADVVEGHGQIVIRKRANRASPEPMATAPQRRVTFSSHHIHRPDPAQNSMAAMNRSTLKDQASSRK